MMTVWPHESPYPSPIRLLPALVKPWMESVRLPAKDDREFMDWLLGGIRICLSILDSSARRIVHNRRWTTLAEDVAKTQQRHPR
jgi:hypothetical protein